MRIKVEREYETRPWMTPNFVNVEVRGDDERTASIPLKDIPAAILSALCDEWRAGVFKQAGKPDPRLAP